MVLLSALPPELLQAIFSSLQNCDIKNLRLACTYLGKVARLRFDRIFLSPHPRDIKVLYEVAQHEIYRDLVTELVYDDARFYKAKLPAWEKDNRGGYMSDGIPTWYDRAFRATCRSIRDCKGDLVERPDHVQTAKQYEARLSLKQSYERYQKILGEQAQVIASGSDIEAFAYALQHLPHIQRVTVTPVAHGVPFRPFYQTPMIRDLPYGFIYPIPRPWPGSEREGRAEHTFPPWENEEEKKQWRGLRIVLRSLAKHPHHVTEFVVEVNQLGTGLSCRMFDNRHQNQEYEDFVSLLRSPGFSRLDLAISTGNQEQDLWPFYRSGLLRDALSEAKGMQHVSLRTDLIIPDSVYEYESGGDEHFFPLTDIFPLDQWKHLRHFGLSGFLVKQHDLIEFLRALPPTLRSVELSFLDFVETELVHYREFVCGMRDKVDWRERPVLERPTITLFIESEPPRKGHCVDISRETEDFLYRDGENPFGEVNENRFVGNRVYRSMGRGIERDMFNPLNDRPFATSQRLMDLGIREPSDFHLRGIRPTLKNRT